jgi:hypothetical protein
MRCLYFRVRSLRSLPKHVLDTIYANMSGVEIVGLISTVLTLASACERLYKLGRSFALARTDIDCVAGQITDLHRALSSLRSFLSKRSTKAKFPSEFLKIVSDNVGKCDKLLNDIDAIVQKALKPQRDHSTGATLNLGGMTRWQLMKPKMLSLKDHLMLCVITLQFLLTAAGFMENGSSRRFVPR